MTAAKKTARMGDTLRIHYECRDLDGNLLETTRDGAAPLVRLGNGEILPALEQAFVGMAEGETRRLTLQPEDAFGEYDPDLIDEVLKADLELEGEPEPGMEPEFEEDGEVYSGIITEITEDTVIIDANHPLAGQTLDFIVTLVGFGK